MIFPELGPIGRSSMARVPASAEPGEATPAAPDQPATRRGRPSRRVLLGIAAISAAAIVVATVALATRGPSSPRLERAEVGAIASDVVEKAIEDLRYGTGHLGASSTSRSSPRSSRSRRGSVVDDGDGAGFGTGVIVNAKRRDPDRAPRGRRCDDASALVFVDGTRSNGRIVSADPENDIAVLMPDRPPQPIVPAVLGGGGQVGDEAYAVGHPLGFVGSLTSGVISGLDRTVEAPGRQDARAG